MKRIEYLPQCDLGDLYPAPDAPSVGVDLDEVARTTAAFRGQYGGRLTHLAVPALLEAVCAYEQLAERAAKLASYATLLAATNGTDRRAATSVETIRVRIGSVLAALAFFPRELGALDEERFQDLLRTPDAEKYAPWLEGVRAVRSHLLSDEAERQSAEEAAVGRAECMRQYDELMETLRVPAERGTTTVGRALRLQSTADPAARAAAARTLAATLGDNVERFTLILNALVEQKQREDQLRGIDRPDGTRNCLNRLGDDVDAVIEAVSANASVAQRFYRLKANWLGQDVLDHWDCSAPLPAVAAMKFQWEEAKALVLQTFELLSPEVAALAGRFFQEGWIDAAPRAGKAGGSACYATVPSVHPYVVVNYRGGVRDLLALAHELAHGVHQVLAADNGFLTASPPPVLAETVAVLAEILLLDGLRQRAMPGPMRDALVALKVEHLIHTIFHHAAIHEFEWRVHRARQHGPLTPAQVNEIWLEAQRKFLGPAVRLGPGYGPYWTCVGHVFRAPFYAYSYVIGGALACSLHDRLLGDGRDMAERYVSVLRLGGRASLTAFLDDRVTSVATLAAAGLEAVGSMVEALESLEPVAT